MGNIHIPYDIPRQLGQMLSDYLIGDNYINVSPNTVLFPRPATKTKL